MLTSEFHANGECRGKRCACGSAISHQAAFEAFYRLRLRTPRTTVKLVWVYIAPQLDWYRPNPVSIAHTAKVLDTKTSTVGRALAFLVRVGLLECEAPARRNLSGWYCLGPAAEAGDAP